jgi:acetylglutamate kinase
MSETPPITVVKIGGQEIAPGPTIERLARWVARAARPDHRLVLVHGGGEEVSERAQALGLPVEKRDGQRVTSPPMLEVVLEVLGGRVNARLVAALGAAGVRAVGLSGASDRLLQAVPLGDPPGALGLVGRPTRVRTSLLLALGDAGIVPVIAPIGIGPSGQLLNVNADLAAGAIARALGADLRLVTNVAGVLDRDGRIIPRMGVGAARRLVSAGVATGGMVPKLEAATGALPGARSVWIGDLDGLEADVGAAGTTVVPEVARPMRPRAAPLRGRV